jgi:hypothetical protein
VKQSGVEQHYNKMPGDSKNHGGGRKNAGQMPAFVKGQQTIFGIYLVVLPMQPRQKRGGTRQKTSGFL